MMVQVLAKGTGMIISSSASGAQANAGQVLATYMMSTANCCVKLENNSRAHTIANSTRVAQAAQAVHAVRTPSCGKGLYRLLGPKTSDR